MNMVIWRAWEALGGLVTPKFVTRETAVLLILAASLLVFRTLRERCLMVWIVGWVAYFVSDHALASAASSPFASTISEAEFIIAVSLFVAGALIYTNSRNALGPLLAISAALVVFAAVRSLYWPSSVTLRFALELSYRVLTLGTAIRLLRFRRARTEIGPWLLAAGLIAVHLDWPPLTAHLPAETNLLADLLLGLGMLLVILDESRIQTRRLAVLNELATTVAHAAQSGSMAASAVEHLTSLMGADAAWFRFINGQRLTIFQHVG